MVRIGKWDEDKILFKPTGHDHSGGAAGAFISKIDALTCIKHGVISIAAAASVYTGLKSVAKAWVQPVATAAATQALVTATSGGTISVTPGAAGQTLWWLAIGYA
ncbi:MAG: hypothetical protein QXX41_08470 [Nitrososphaerota archaeon]